MQQTGFLTGKNDFRATDLVRVDGEKLGLPKVELEPLDEEVLRRKPWKRKKRFEFTDDFELLSDSD